MATGAAYDDIADWYEKEFLTAQRAFSEHREFADFLGIDQAVTELLGAGCGRCLEIGCGTGIYASRIRSLGWSPLGIDIAIGMLRHAQSRLPVARADACDLPLPDASVEAAVSVMIHSDIARYEAVLAEAQRVIVSGGTFVHIGVHPCFCGDFAERAGMDSARIGSGYLQRAWTPALGPDQGALGQDGQIRDKVGAGHIPLAELLNAVTNAGFTIERCFEGGAPIPITFSLRAVRV